MSKVKEEKKSFNKCTTCGIRAFFASYNNGIQSKCEKHQSKNMFDTRIRKCHNPDCTKRPSYGYPNGRPMRCEPHKLPGMENINTKKCSYPGCKKQPSYGPDGIRDRCSEHKITGMVIIVNDNKVCREAGCKTLCSYGIEMGKPLYCALHNIFKY
jgi:hypothetical protein